MAPYFFVRKKLADYADPADDLGEVPTHACSPPCFKQGGTEQQAVGLVGVVLRRVQFSPLVGVAFIREARLPAPFIQERACGRPLLSEPIISINSQGRCGDPLRSWCARAGNRPEVERQSHATERHARRFPLGPPGQPRRSASEGASLDAMWKHQGREIWRVYEIRPTAGTWREGEWSERAVFKRLHNVSKKRSFGSRHEKN